MSAPVIIGNATLYLGDCLEILRTLPDSSVDSVVTDPPYGLAFMGKRWDYDVPSEAIWRECLRVLKPGGHLLAFAGTRTQHRMAVRIEDAGFEIRDMIAWVYGSGFPKSHNLHGEWEGWGTALKPALEPITVARKPLEGTVAANVLAHGTGALNIDGCRVGYLPDERVQTFWNNRGGATINASEGQGAKPRTGEDAYDPSKGRWPANLIHDGSDEVLAEFARYGDKGAAAPVHRRNSDKFRNSYGTFKGNVDEAGSTFHGDRGTAARFFYCAKASKADRDEGLEGALRNTHPTVKPTALMRYLCRLVTPPGGVVLDPFMGSGSTGKATMLEGFRFIGCELDPDYAAIARARIAATEKRVADDRRRIEAAQRQGRLIA